ncbi:MAG: hypothetical protein NC416_16005 [Eubacterium sp.]|nr:hypothetical protein [Eubacterium sp.]
MSDGMDRRRKRRQNLLIVEGNHERDKLFSLIFRCFPEMNIDMEDVWIYGTNIYMLYEDIVKEYGDRWTEDEIDLPFVISRKQSPESLRYKEDFVNIILVFDYERHDPNFSEKKIIDMQNYFVDAADTGRLYINYPMIESYQHLRTLPDEDYAERKIPVSLQPGRRYKELVRNETGIVHFVEFPNKIRELLSERFGITDRQACGECCESILNISDAENIENHIQKILQHAIEDKRLRTAICHFSVLIKKLGYAHRGETYWNYMRSIFIQIILHNICKAQKVQKGQYQIADDAYRESFANLDLYEILKAQNLFSQNMQSGFIWVLNTSVFFVAEYNFNLLT